jgi:hypothetical protein
MKRLARSADRNNFGGASRHIRHGGYFFSVSQHGRMIVPIASSRVPRIMPPSSVAGQNAIHNPTCQREAVRVLSPSAFRCAATRSEPSPDTFNAVMRSITAAVLASPSWQLITSSLCS